MEQTSEDLAFGNGMVEAATVANDPRLAEASQILYRQMRSGLITDATAYGSVLGLFRSTVWRPEDGTRRPCLVALYDRAVGVYWEKGAFKKVVHKRLIDRDIITGGEVGPGPEEATRHASVLTIKSSEEPCLLAIPKNNQRLSLWVLRHMGPTGSETAPVEIAQAGEINEPSSAVDPASSEPTDGAHPAEWAADPSGRHELRYWDGTAWTHHVADNGVAGTDPLDP